MSDALEAARDYRRRGLPITLCPPGAKNPLGEGWTDIYAGKAWQRKEWSIREICRAFRARGELNVGCLWGPRSNIIDIEVDSPADKEALAELFDGSDPPVTPAFQSPRGPHRLFAWNPALDQLGKATVHFNGLEIKIGARGKGAHSLLPPSDSGGVERKWLIPLDECDPAPLPGAVVRRILAIQFTLPNIPTRRAQTQANPLHVLHDPIEGAIARTLPTRIGERNRRIFDFARELRANYPADTPVADLLPHVRRWHSAALPIIGTKPWEETWFDFAVAWSKPMTPAGDPPKISEQFEQPSLRLLVALCRELQRRAGDGSFFLDCRSAGKLLGVDHVTAWRWLRGLCKVSVLRCESIGRHETRQANTYRYLADL